MVFFSNLATGARRLVVLASAAGAFATAVAAACEDLATQMVGDAEGHTKVVRVRITGATSDDEARRAARAVAESQLAKCSWFGGDPYWGRVASDLGTAGVKLDLAELTKKGPVLVRLTCGCSGCDKELAYFQEIDAAYKKYGLTSVAIFKEGDAKVAKYAQEKKINMLYGVDTKGASWDIFQTKTMPTNFLIGKGGEVIAIAPGCDTSGLLAKKLSERIAKTVDAPAVDVKAKVNEKK